MRLGWYVHHHGSGHLQRFLAVRERLPGVVGLSSLARPPALAPEEWIELPMDAPADPAAAPEAGGALHWAPLHHAGLRRRMATIARWIDAERPRALVCDVSVEVALLARLHGVPVVWIAQRGRRDDEPHRLAYRACSVIAPWTRELDVPGSGLPAGVEHIGALSRFDDRAPSPSAHRHTVAVLLGRGGHAVSAAQLHAAARACPGWSFTVAGLGEAVDAPLRDAGSPTDVWPLLCDAEVVVGTPGGGLVGEVAAARRAFVCIPQARPFDEQHDAGAALARHGLAETLVHWPDPGAWPAILDRAAARDPDRWSLLHDGRAGERLAAAIRRVATDGPR